MPQPLITVQRLSEQLDDVALFDIRWALTDPNHGRATYQAGHIPGAVFVDLDADLAAPPGIDGRHPLPTIEDWAKTLGSLGVTPTTEVVVYDDMEGAVAARMWWMLVSMGHESVRLLDGGYKAWTEAGGDVETGDNRPSPADYPTPEGFAGVVSREQLAGRTVVDVRASERYRGDNEPVDPKAGHIPGAINLPLGDSLGSRGLFLPPDELQARFASITDSPVVHCGSGVNACHTALAMVLAGRSMPDVYAGSFSEWARRDLPVNTGDQP